MADVVDLVEYDHREVEQLFSDFESSRDGAVATKICDELTKHTFGEERAVYPVIAGQLSEGEQLAREAENEHKEARQLIGRIRNTTDESHLAELMSELEQAIQHHVSEEESQMLPKARQEISSDQLDQMGRDFEEAKQAARRQSG
jgi:iron-sulfur cluster repair protein YtfE (RIC family)